MTNKSHKGPLYGKRLLILGIFLTVINAVILFSVIGSAVYKQIINNQKNGKIIIKDVSASEIDKISSQIVYTGMETGITKYYSPALDTLFGYNSDKYTIYEGNDYVGINSKSSLIMNLYSSIRITPKEETSILEKRLAYYQTIFTNVKKNSEGTLEGLSYIKISYDSASLIVDKGKTTSFKIILSKEVGAKVIYVEISYPEGYAIDEMAADIAKMLNSAEISPTNLDTNIKVGIAQANAEFQYDKSKWTVNSHSEYSISMDFRNQQYEKETEYKSKFSSFSISAGNNYAPLKTASSLLEEYIGYDQAFYKNFKMITQEGTKNISGIDFKYSEYSYVFAGDNAVITRLAGTYGDKYMIIKIDVPSKSTVAFTEAENIIKSIKIIQPTIQSSVETAVLGTSTLEVDNAAIIGKPAVVHIFNRSCATVKMPTAADLRYSGGKSYELCMAATGTGFYVSNDGYIITNGHVATPDPLDISVDTLLYASNSLPQFWADFDNDVFTLMLQSGQNPLSYSSNDLVSIIAGVYVDLVEKGQITLTSKSENYIEQSDAFIVDPYSLTLSNASKQLKAETIGGQVDSQIRLAYESAQITKPDLAILKVTPTSSDIPVLKLSDPKMLSVGQKINVIGYPGSAENTTIYASSASTIATITNGSISAIKPNGTNTFKLLQIDASISYGNSGGPILNTEGEVVGVATYKISGDESADFNAGVSVEEVLKFLSSKGITVKSGAVTELLNFGVENFSNEYYKLAIKDFNAVIEIYPGASEILTPLINISNEKISKGEDKSPLINIAFLDKMLKKAGIAMTSQTVVILLITGIGLVLSGIFVFVMLRKKKSANVVETFTPPPTPNIPTQIPTQIPIEKPIEPITSMSMPINSKLPPQMENQTQTLIPPLQTTAKPFNPPQPVPLIQAQPVPSIPPIEEKTTPSPTVSFPTV